MFDELEGHRARDRQTGAPAAGQARVIPFRTFDPEGGPDDDVPDPYYGGAQGFEEVFRIVGRTCEVLLDRILDGTWREVVDGA